MWCAVTYIYMHQPQGSTHEFTNYEFSNRKIVSAHGGLNRMKN